MFLPIGMMPTFSDNIAVFEQQGAYTRIWRNAAKTVAAYFHSPEHGLMTGMFLGFTIIGMKKHVKSMR